MDSLSRYHLSMHENGSWNVIDARTGGPAEVLMEDGFQLLFNLTRDEAEAWSLRLNRINPESAKPRP